MNMKEQTSLGLSPAGWRSWESRSHAVTAYTLALADARDRQPDIRAGGRPLPV